MPGSEAHTATDTADRPFQPRHHAGRTPEKTAFHICATGETVSFAALEARANQGAHRLRPVLGESFAFEELPAALEHLRGPERFGKTLIRFS